MRRLLPLVLLLPSPALAQFPPPRVYDCVDANGTRLGALSLLVAGDYQWEANGAKATGQIASAGTSVEALSGPLADAHWRGEFTSSDTGETVFVFGTDTGQVSCGP